MEQGGGFSLWLLPHLASKENERRMIVCREHRLIYLSIQRTGSTAMEQLLLAAYGGERVGKKHSAGGEMRKWLQAQGEQRTDWHVATSVRNPYDSLVSKWNKLLSNHKGRKLGEQAEAVRAGELTFGDWLEAGQFRQFQNQIQRFTRHADTHLRFETLAADWLGLCAKLEMPHVEIPVVNRTEKEGKSFESYYTPELVAVIRPHLKEFLEAFSYPDPV